MDTLIINSNSGGFFSNCNILLSNIIIYFNNYQKLPIKITTNNLFSIYKSNDEEDLYNLLFYNHNFFHKFFNDLCNIFFLASGRFHY